MEIKIDKFGSATSVLMLPATLKVFESEVFPAAGDVVIVRARSESVTYGNLELPSGRMAKINRGDILAGVFGKRRALKGFVGDIPLRASGGDRLHLLNLGGLIGECMGHHSSFSDAIEVEVIGLAIDEYGKPLNIAANALPPADLLLPGAPLLS
jgi:hypothetical protein